MKVTLSITSLLVTALAAPVTPFVPGELAAIGENFKGSVPLNQAKREANPLDIPLAIISGGPAFASGGGNAQGGNVGSGGNGAKGGNGGIKVGKRQEESKFSLPKIPITIVSGGPAFASGGGNAQGGNVGSGGNGRTGGNGGVQIGRRQEESKFSLPKINLPKIPVTIVSGGPALAVGGGGATGGNVGSGGNGVKGGKGGISIGKRQAESAISLPKINLPKIPVTIVSGGPAIAVGGGNAQGGSVGSGGNGKKGGNGAVRIGERAEQIAASDFSLPKIPKIGIPPITIVTGGPAIAIGKKKNGRNVDEATKDEPLDKRIEIVLPSIGVGIDGGHAVGGSTGGLKPGIHFKRKFVFGKPGLDFGDSASAVGESVAISRLSKGDVITGGAAVAVGKGATAKGGDVNSF